MRMLSAPLLILFASAALADIGEVTDIIGSGVIKREQQVTEGMPGALLKMQDVIATAQGRMELQFEDDTRVDVTEHSRMVIDEFVYDPGSRSGALSMRATLGAVRYASGQIAHNNRRNVNIKTPSATIGVRGTDFIMVVDELGGSMITLLPSCNDQGNCVVGEISVESAVGTVIMNQAFQTTVVSNTASAPTEPLTLDLPESMLTAMLIVRRTDPYTAAENNKDNSTPNVLDIDFLEFKELEKDYLADQTRNQWVTDLDSSYFNEVLSDQLRNLMKEIIALFLNELDAQNSELLRVREQGLDPETGIYYTEEPPIYTVRRQENDHQIQLDLSQNHGYRIDIVQDGFSLFGYRLGDAGNSIYIKQTE